MQGGFGIVVNRSIWPCGNDTRLNEIAACALAGPPVSATDQAMVPKPQVSGTYNSQPAMCKRVRVGSGSVRARAGLRLDPNDLPDSTNPPPCYRQVRANGQSSSTMAPTGIELRASHFALRTENTTVQPRPNFGNSSTPPTFHRSRATRFKLSPSRLGAKMERSDAAAPIIANVRQALLPFSVRAGDNAGSVCRGWGPVPNRRCFSVT